MTDSLKDLIDRTRNTRMTPLQEEAQRRSFAYGNAKIENDRVTRSMVNEAADRIKTSESK